MPPVSWTWFMRGFLANIPHVCLWSSHLFPRPSEWPENVLVGGYASLVTETVEPDKSDYTPSQSLRNFIFNEVEQTNRQHVNGNGAPMPLTVVSLGSMHIKDPAKFLSMLSWALEQVNARAVVCGNWQVTKVMPQTDCPHARHSRIYVADQSIPHTWLLRHATGGFVHHGGAGHTGAGLRAGVPMFMVPFMLDQHFWAAQAYRLGLGPAPVPFRCLTAAKLAESLQVLLNTGDKKGGLGAQMASLIRAEADGADVAAMLILRQLGLPLQLDPKTHPEENICAALGKRNADVPCCLLPTLLGTWRHTGSGLLLSGAAAACLVSEGVLSWDDLDIQPRIDRNYWCGRERLLGGGVRALSQATRFLALVYGFVWMLLACLVQFKIPRRDQSRLCKEEGVISNLGRLARIRQAKSDLAVILEPRGHCSEVLEDAESHGSVSAELRVEILSKWNALSAATSNRAFYSGVESD